MVGVLGAGLDQDEFATMEERRRISFDHLLGQMIIGKMRLEGPHNGVMIRFGWRSGLGIAPNDCRSIARCKDGRADVDCLSRHDTLIVDSVFKSRASQSLDGFVKIPCVVKYPNSGRHGICGCTDGAIGRQTSQEVFRLPPGRKMTSRRGERGVGSRQKGFSQSKGDFSRLQDEDGEKFFHEQVTRSGADCSPPPLSYSFATQ